MVKKKNFKILSFIYSLLLFMTIGIFTGNTVYGTMEVTNAGTKATTTTKAQNQNGGEDSGEDYSLYNVAGALADYMNDTLAPGKKDQDNRSFEGLNSISDIDAGSFLGYPSEKGIKGWISAKVSLSSNSFTHESLAAVTGNDQLLGYARYGYFLNDIGIDKSGSPGMGGIPRRIGGSISYILYLLNGFAARLFGAVIEVLKLLNPFRFFYFMTVEAPFATQLKSLFPDTDVFTDIINVISKAYNALYEVGRTFTVPIFFSTLVCGYLLFRNSGSGKKGLKKYIVRIMFIFAGVPLLAAAYTEILDEFSTGSLNVTNNPANYVIGTTFVDFESWAKNQRLAIPKDISEVFMVDRMPSGTRTNRAGAYAHANLRQVAAGINSFSGALGPKATLDAGAISMDNNFARDPGVPIYNKTDDIQDAPVLNIIERYMNSDFYYPSDWESSVKAFITNKYGAGDITDKIKEMFVENGDSKKIAADKEKIPERYADSGGKYAGYNIFTNGGIVAQPAGATAFLYSDTGGGFSLSAPEYSALEINGNNRSSGLSTVALYNYLTTKFDSSNITIYSPHRASSGFVVQNHYSVNLIGRGMTSFLYWLHGCVWMTVTAIVSMVFAFGMIGSILKSSFHLIVNALSGVAGYLKGIAKAIAYTVIMMIEIVITMFLYSMALTFVSTVGTAIEKSILAVFKDGQLGKAFGPVSLIVSSIILVVVAYTFMRVRGPVIKGFSEAITSLIDKFIFDGEASAASDIAKNMDTKRLDPLTAGAAAGAAGKAFRETREDNAEEDRLKGLSEGGSASSMGTGSGDGEDSEDSDSKKTDEEKRTSLSTTEDEDKKLSEHIDESESLEEAAYNMSKTEEEEDKAFKNNVSSRSATGNARHSLPGGADQKLSEEGLSNISHDEDGNEYESVYDENGNEVGAYINGSEKPYIPLQDANGNAIAGHDEKGRPVNAEGKPVRAFDSEGREAVKFDKDGNAITFKGKNGGLYDYNGHRVPVAGAVAAEKTGAASAFAIDGSRVQYFDEDNNALDSEGNKIQAYDKDARPITAFDEHNNPMTVRGGTERNPVYTDMNGNRVSSAGARQRENHGSKAVYDSRGRKITEFDKNGNPLDADGNVTTGYTSDNHAVSSYDENGVPLTVVTGSGTREIDHSAPMPEKKIMPMERTNLANEGTRAVYDKDGVKLTRFNGQGQPIDTAGNVVQGYTKDGNKVTAYDADGIPTEAIEKSTGIAAPVKHDSGRASYAPGESPVVSQRTGAGGVKINVIPFHTDTSASYTKNGEKIVTFNEDGQAVNARGQVIDSYTSSGQLITKSDSNGVPMEVKDSVTGNTVRVSHTPTPSPVTAERKVNGQTIVTRPYNEGTAAVKDASGEKVVTFNEQGQPVNQSGQVIETRTSNGGIAGGFDRNGIPHTYAMPAGNVSSIKHDTKVSDAPMKPLTSQKVNGHTINTYQHKGTQASYDANSNIITTFNEQGQPVNTQGEVIQAFNSSGEIVSDFNKNGVPMKVDKGSSGGTISHAPSAPVVTGEKKVNGTTVRTMPFNSDTRAVYTKDGQKITTFNEDGNPVNDRAEVIPAYTSSGLRAGDFDRAGVPKTVITSGGEKKEIKHESGSGSGSGNVSTLKTSEGVSSEKFVPSPSVQKREGKTDNIVQFKPRGGSSDTNTSGGTSGGSSEKTVSDIPQEKMASGETIRRNPGAVSSGMRSAYVPSSQRQRVSIEDNGGFIGSEKETFAPGNYGSSARNNDPYREFVNPSGNGREVLRTYGNEGRNTPSPENYGGGRDGGPSSYSGGGGGRNSGPSSYPGGGGGSSPSYSGERRNGPSSYGGRRPAPAAYGGQNISSQVKAKDPEMQKEGIIRGGYRALKGKGTAYDRKRSAGAAAVRALIGHVKNRDEFEKQNDTERRSRIAERYAMEDRINAGIRHEENLRMEYERMEAMDRLSESADRHSETIRNTSLYKDPAKKKSRRKEKSSESDKRSEKRAAGGKFVDY